MQKLQSEGCGMYVIGIVAGRASGLVHMNTCVLLHGAKLNWSRNDIG